MGLPDRPIGQEFMDKSEALALAMARSGLKDSSWGHVSETVTMESPCPSQVFPEPVLVVEDEDSVRTLLLRKLARSGWQVSGAANGLEALRLLGERAYAIVLSDINMPKLGGMELLQIIRETYPDTVVVMVTAYSDLNYAIAAMKLGASDYLVKPFKLDDVVDSLRLAGYQRTRNLNRKHAEDDLRQHPHTESNQRLLLSSVMALANTLEAKDPYTVGHSQRVAALAERMARKLGLSEAETEHIRLAGLLHDIGKIGIREDIINKPGPLAPEEYDHIRTHPGVSERILLPVRELNGALQIIRHHHERWNGSGYPDGLKGQEIPTGARLLAIADAYDAMTSKRPYRPAMTSEDALKELSRTAGTDFDPTLSRLFVEMIQEPK
jgi:putative nucleotidyltransferase with HDIG domain